MCRKLQFLPPRQICRIADLSAKLASSLDTIPQISVQELAATMPDRVPCVLDVREPGEWGAGTIAPSPSRNSLRAVFTPFPLNASGGGPGRGNKVGMVEAAGVELYSPIENT